MAIFEVLNNQQSYFNRHFRRNVGDDDYATIPEVTLAGAFSISYSYLAGSLSSFDILFASLSDTDNYFGITNLGKVRLKINGFNSDTADGAVDLDNKIHTGVISRDVAGNISIADNGVVIGTGNLSGDFLISALYKNSSGFNWHGILANLKIYDNGTLIRDYPLDEPKGTSTIYDLVGGNNGTIINGNDEDKGLFTKQANGDWLGNDLDVPPWDSVDQTLPVA